MGTFLLGNSHAIAKPSRRVLVTEWGSLLCGGALVFFPHIKQFDCFLPNASGVQRCEVSYVSGCEGLVDLVSPASNDVPKN